MLQNLKVNGRQGCTIRSCGLLLTTLLLIGCGAGPSYDLANAPEWLQAKVENLQVDSSVSFAITRWEYKAKTVYYFPPAMPDGLGCL